MSVCDGGGVESQNLLTLTPPPATLSSACARNGGLGTMVPLGQVHTLPDGGWRTAGASWETARRLSRCFFFFFSFCLLRLGSPAFPSFPLLPTLSPLDFNPLTSECVHTVPLLFFPKCCWVVQIVVSGASGAYSGTPECSQSWIHRGLFSITAPPLATSTAEPLLSFSASALFVFSHGLLSQPQVSLIINDPKGDRPLVALEVLDPTA